MITSTECVFCPHCSEPMWIRYGEGRFYVSVEISAAEDPKLGGRGSGIQVDPGEEMDP